MKNPEDELWTQIFKLWPAAMKYEDAPVFHDTAVLKPKRSRLPWKRS